MQTIPTNATVEHVILIGDSHISQTYDMAEIIDQAKHNHANRHPMTKHMGETKRALLSYVSIHAMLTEWNKPNSVIDLTA